MRGLDLACQAQSVDRARFTGPAARGGGAGGVGGTTYFFVFRVSVGINAGTKPSIAESLVHYKCDMNL